MNFDLDPELVELRDRVFAFVRDEVIPAEGEGLSHETIARLQQSQPHGGSPRFYPLAAYN